MPPKATLPQLHIVDETNILRFKNYSLIMQ